LVTFWAFFVKGKGMNGVLVLNATYEPLNIVTVRRAVILLLKEKAEIVEATEAQLRSEKLSLPVPLVIRLVYYVKIPRLLGPPLSRRTVLARDYYTCQYCGDQPGRGNLTVDHILPRSRGGQTVWKNVVTACKRCNGRKGDHTPEEVGMRPRTKPRRPRYVALALLGAARENEIWGKYIR
jgi:5-methylcytosine-specific restriction endonuclease McrA